MERDPDHPQNQPDLSDYGRALLSRGASRFTTFPSLCSSISLLMPSPPVCSGVAVLKPLPQGPLVGPGAPPSGVRPLLQSDSALWAGSHTVAVHWVPAGTSATVLRLSLPVLYPHEITKNVSSSSNPSSPPPTGDLLHCVSRALCGRQNPSVC